MKRKVGQSVWSPDIQLIDVDRSTAPRAVLLVCLSEEASKSNEWLLHHSLSLAHVETSTAGDCFFDGVCKAANSLPRHLLQGHPELTQVRNMSPLTLRKSVVDFLSHTPAIFNEMHFNTMLPEVTGTEEERQTHYLKLMSEEETWADELIIRATASYLNVRLCFTLLIVPSLPSDEQTFPTLTLTHNILASITVDPHGNHFSALETHEQIQLFLCNHVGHFTAFTFVQKQDTLTSTSSSSLSSASPSSSTPPLPLTSQTERNSETAKATTALQDLFFSTLLSKYTKSTPDEKFLLPHPKTNEVKEWPVQRILKFKCTDALEPKTYQFLIEFAGWPTSHNKWIQLEDMSGCMKKIAKFLLR